MHVIGLTAETNRDRVALATLEAPNKWRFDTWNEHTGAYLDLFVESFNGYSRRDSETDLVGVHALVHLNGSDLIDALVICDSIERDLLERPGSWRAFIGVIREPGKDERRIEPLMFRRRALTCVARLRALIRRAVSERKAVVCGSGAYYRALCGISGGEYYS
jgi:hypothetical protein